MKKEIFYLFDFTSFFALTFLNFLACCELTELQVCPRASNQDCSNLPGIKLASFRIHSVHGAIVGLVDRVNQITYKTCLKCPYWVQLSVWGEIHMMRAFLVFTLSIFSILNFTWGLWPKQLLKTTPLQFCKYKYNYIFQFETSHSTGLH